MDVGSFYLTGVLLLSSACFTGVEAQACLSDCAQLKTDLTAADASNNNVDFCKLSSRYIFCLISNKPNCHDNNATTAANSILANTRTKYYANCGLTENDITTCSTSLSGQCSADFSTAQSHLLKQEYVQYCQTVRVYLRCIKEKIPTVCSNSKVSPTDAVGNAVLVYGSSICKGDNPNFQQCHAVFAKTCGSFTSCSSVSTLKACAETTQCTEAGKSRLLQFINTSYVAPCAQVEQAKICRNLTMVCSALLMSASELLKTGDTNGCQTKLDAAIECYQGLTGCGNISSQMGIYRTMCTTPVVLSQGPVCPNFTNCIYMLKPTTTSSQNYSAMIQSLQQTCSVVGQFMDCSHNTFRECGVVFKTTYDFAALKENLKSGCIAMTNNKLLSCATFSVCLGSFGASLGRDVQSPEFYCRYGKGLATCAKYSAKSCDLDNDASFSDTVEQMLSFMNTKCPSADVFVPSCPAAAECKSKFSIPITENAFGVFQAVCQEVPEGLRCLNGKASECQLAGLQSYSYADLANGVTSLCTAITENAAIGACSAFTDCLGKVEVEKLNSHYTNPKFLCKLLARTAACAAWSASTCLPSNATAKTSFETIMQEWYSKCPNIDLPYSSCNQAMTCMQAVSSFRGYSGTSVVDICPHMKSVMTCLKNALKTCSIKQASNYDFAEMATYFEQTCNILKNPANTALKDCKKFDSCIRQISNPDQAKMPAVYPDPRYWCGVIRDAATCAFKSANGCNIARNSELKKDSADVVNSVSTKCPIDGFQKITFQVAAAPSMFTSASVITILIAFLSPVLL